MMERQLSDEDRKLSPELRFPLARPPAPQSFLQRVWKASIVRVALYYLVLIGVAVFAASGASAAVAKRLRADEGIAVRFLSSPPGPHPGAGARAVHDAPHLHSLVDGAHHADGADAGQPACLHHFKAF